MIEGIGSIVV